MSSLAINEKALQKQNEILVSANVNINVAAVTSLSSNDKASLLTVTANIITDNSNSSNEVTGTASNELDENDNYYEQDQDYCGDDDDDYDDDCNYDDDHNNNYICESGDEDFGDENDLYLNNPEHFEYESIPIEQIDTVVEKKCQKILSNLSLDDPLDSIYILKKFNWNCENIIELYNKDKLEFLKTYFSDDNNNTKSKAICKDKLRLTSYINIFTDKSNLFKSISFTDNNIQNLDKCLADTKAIQINNDKNKSNDVVENYCNICCMSTTNSDLEMCALDECQHYFCINCWRQHFESLINFGAYLSSTFECMQTKCSSIANKEFVLKCLNYNSLTSTSNQQETPKLPSSLSSNVNKLIIKNYPERYRQMVCADLVKESDDLQICPGDSIVNQTCVNSTTPITPLARASAITAVSQLSSAGSIISQSPMLSVSANVSPKSTSSVYKYPTSASYTTPSLFSTIYSGKLNNSLTFDQSGSTCTKKCNYIVWAKSKPAARRVVCSFCTTQYCFLCSSPYHAPNGCDTIRKWNLKCQDDSETRNYLLVHTQDCPKCKVCIEKNGGCSHMTCNRCKNEFCWVCLNDWKTHGATYDCNRYKGNPDQDNAREALNRYTHYYHRWINHSNSLKFEKAFKEQCQLKIHEKIMNKGGGTLVDWEFFTEAVDTLTRARYTLQYTYPYAYYLEDNESKLLFENIQAELEREVENLSHSLEKVNLNDKYNIKTQMNIVEKRRKTLLKDFIQ